MTSINSSDSIGISHRSSRVDNSSSSTSKSKVAVTTNQSLSSLTDISKLADEAARSGEDIRPEAIDRDRNYCKTQAGCLTITLMDSLAN